MRQAFLRQSQLSPAGADALAEDIEVWIAHSRNERS
jgi:hypothetical protein